MMAEATKTKSRIVPLALCAAALSACLIAPATTATRAQNPPRPAQPQPAKKKKLPPGARGFEQYATRDASDKLATGGATRDPADDFKMAMTNGDKLYEEGKYREAAEAYTRASKMKTSVFRAFYALGASYEAAGMFKEASAAYKAAVALKPDSASDKPEDLIYAHYNLANSYASAGQHAEAAEAYRQLIARLDQLKAPLAQPHYNLGLSLAALGRADEAAASFGKAVELNPQYAEAHYNLGVIHSRAERYTEAVASFKQALAAKPDYPEARYNLGLAYYFMDDNAGLLEQHKALRAMKTQPASDFAKELSKLTSGK